MNDDTRETRADIDALAEQLTRASEGRDHRPAAARDPVRASSCEPADDAAGSTADDAARDPMGYSTSNAGSNHASNPTRIPAHHSSAAGVPPRAAELLQGADPRRRAHPPAPAFVAQFEACPEHGDYPLNELDAHGTERWHSPGCPACRRVLAAGNLMRRAAIAPRFMHCGFDNFSAETPAQHSALAICRRYADDFEQVHRGGRCLILRGLPGTGKNHLATAIARSVLARGMSVLNATAHEIIARVRESWAGNGRGGNPGGNHGGAHGNQGGAFGNQGGAFGNQGGAFGNQGGAYGNHGGAFSAGGANPGGGGGRAWAGPQSEQDVIAEFAELDLLIIDEVGRQYKSREGADNIELFNIIDARYRRVRPTIIISNFEREQIRDTLGAAAYDRLREGGGALANFDWPSHRGANPPAQGDAGTVLGGTAGRADTQGDAAAPRASADARARPDAQGAAARDTAAPRNAADAPADAGAPAGTPASTRAHDPAPACLDACARPRDRIEDHQHDDRAVHARPQAHGDAAPQAAAPARAQARIDGQAHADRAARIRTQVFAEAGARASADPPAATPASTRTHEPANAGAPGFASTSTPSATPTPAPPRHPAFEEN